MANRRRGHKDLPRLFHQEPTPRTPEVAERALRLVEILDGWAAGLDWEREEEEIEDHFRVVKVMDGRIWLEGMIERKVYGPLAVPKEASELLELDWAVTAVLGRAGRKWQLVEVSRVEPR